MTAFIYLLFFLSFSTGASIKVETREQQTASDVCFSLHIYSAASGRRNTLWQEDLE